MRAFIVLCLVAAACAQSGYNYGAGIGNGGFGAGSNVGPSYAGGAAGPSYGGGSIGSAGPSYGGGNHGSAGPSYGGGNLGAANNDAPAFAPQGGELEKEFYTYTANDEDFVEPAASNQYANNVKQGLRVIFIKGPENNGLENAALALAKHAAEQRTDIYVLNKQLDLSGLADKLNNVNSNINNKPEVHFVKYRTPEDAANAQKAIQGQYDQLGGSSQNYNGGVAPVLNFASQAPVAPQAPRGSYGAGSAPSNSYLAPSAGGNVSPNYLPASVFRRYRH